MTDVNLNRLLFAPALLATLAVPAAAQQRSVTLSEAIAMAQRVQVNLLAAQGAVRTAAAAKTAVVGEYLPNVNANASGSHSYSEFQTAASSGQILSGTNTTVSTGLSASIDLFTGFRRGADMAAAKAGQLSAAAGVVSAKYVVVVNTTAAFIAALTQRQLVSVDSVAVVLTQTELKAATDKMRAGAATKGDSLTAMVAFGNAQLSLVNAQAALVGAEASLAHIIGLDGQASAQDDSAYYLVITNVDTAAIRRDALAMAPVLQAAEASADAAHANLRAAKSGYWPTLSASANASWSGSEGQNYELLPNRSVGLQLSWPLFNRFTRERNIITNEVAAEIADATAIDARRQLNASLTQAIASLQAAGISIRIGQISISSADEALRVVQERYRAGAATIVDVMTAQSSLNSAQVTVLQARFSYLNAKAALEALIGRSL
ncbi:MAG: TolC family protein [Gemmatimonadales bacterium]